MSQASLLHQAKQGNPSAIEQLLAQSFARHAIEVAVNAPAANHLQVVLKGAKLPAADQWLPRLQQGFTKLGVRQDLSITVCGQQIGETIDWQAAIAPSSTAPSPNNPFPPLEQVDLTQMPPPATTAQSLKSAQSSVPRSAAHSSAKAPLVTAAPVTALISVRTAAIALSALGLLVITPMAIRRLGQLVQSADTAIRTATVTPQAQPSSSPIFMSVVGRGQQAHYIERGEFTTEIDNLGLDVEVPDGYIFEVPTLDSEKIIYTIRSPKGGGQSYVAAVFAIQDGQTINRAYVDADSFYVIVCRSARSGERRPELPKLEAGQVNCGADAQELASHPSG